jgi:hypothetical protein
MTALAALESRIGKEPIHLLKNQGSLFVAPNSFCVHLTASNFMLAFL